MQKNRIGIPNTTPLPQEEYDFVVERVPRLCVDLAVMNRGEILLSRRAIKPYENLWHLPGGRLLFMESLDQAIRRIATKECGLEVLKGKLLGTVETDDTLVGSDGTERPRHSVSVVYRIEVTGGTLRGDSQSSELKYFSRLPPLEEMHPFHGPFLKERWS